jgi:hypothetical protein
MPTFAGQMSQTPPGDPQWVLCDGKYYYSHSAPIPGLPRPIAGVSKGTFRDYWRNVRGFSGTRGINGFMIRMPYDPAASWYISRADDNNETTIPGAPTPQNPPAGVR